MEFKRLAEVTAAEEAAETANVLIEEGGEIKRVPKTAVGGASAGPVFTRVEASTYAAAATPTYVYNCSMTFEETLAQYNDGTLMPATYNEIYTAGYDFGIIHCFHAGTVAFDKYGDILYPAAAESAYALLFAVTTSLGSSASIYYLNDGTVTTEEPTFETLPK